MQDIAMVFALFMMFGVGVVVGQGKDGKIVTWIKSKFKRG